jgi:hypothetical protein
MTDKTAARYECPECGRVFARPPALGAHRRRAHGVPGTSRSGRTTRMGNDSSKRTVGGANEARVDHDILLQTLFPMGVPARADVVADVYAWLEEARRLTELGGGTMTPSDDAIGAAA